LQTAASIPVNRPYDYEKAFFKDRTSVLQGILFPLKRTPFKHGKLKLGKAARKAGISRGAVDARNISYAGRDK